jgi:sigma-E factor negative regulatory protein RseB
MPVFLRRLAELSRQSAFACALLTGLVSVSVHAATDCALPSEVHTVLGQFLAARSTWGYEGTLLLEQNNQRQFITVAKQPGAQVSLRRMNVPQADSAQQFPVLGGVPGVDPCDIGDSYMVSLEAGATVAGLETWRLTMRPRDNLRFGYVMELDRQSGLPLRVVTITPEGQMIERYEFATIQVATAGSTPDSGMPSVEPTFTLGQLPPGFSLSPRYGAANQVVVSDGLATASVFLEPLPEALQSGEGTVRHGSTVTYTRGVRTTELGWLVTVIGEVPVNTARLLAASVRVPDPSPEAAPQPEAAPEPQSQPQSQTNLQTQSDGA